jgi:hypothetical protein
MLIALILTPNTLWRVIAVLPVIHILQNDSTQALLRKIVFNGASVQVRSCFRRLFDQ